MSTELYLFTFILQSFCENQTVILSILDLILREDSGEITRMLSRQMSTAVISYRLLRFGKKTVGK